jgi:hypothetical protein
MDRLNIRYPHISCNPYHQLGISVDEVAVKLNKNRATLSQINKYTVENEEVKQIEDKPKKFNLKEEIEKLDPIETVAAHNDHWDEPGEMEKMMRDIERIKQLKKGEK